MRETEKHLVDVPLKQLSRISQLIVELRSKPDDLEKYPSYQNFKSAMQDYLRFMDLADHPLTKMAHDAKEIQKQADSKWYAVLFTIGDLISEAVWPA